MTGNLLIGIFAWERIVDSRRFKAVQMHHVFNFAVVQAHSLQLYSIGAV